MALGTKLDWIKSKEFKLNLNKIAILILSSGTHSIRFRPHLTVKKSEIDFAIDIIIKSINKILK